MSDITIDFETKSWADLLKVGAWAYSEDPSTDLICLTYGIEHEPVEAWWPEMENRKGCGPMPKRLREAIQDGLTVEAHNVSFEWAVWENVLMPRYGWVLPELEQWRDTMAVAAYYAMPMKLEQLARALGYDGKDPEGRRLITRYSCLYNKTAKDLIPDDDFQKFVDYCEKDTLLEQAISDELGDLPEREIPIFQLDLRKGRRGLTLDRRGIAVAARIVEQREAELVGEFRTLTGVNPTQRDKFLAWLAEHGVKLPDMKKDTLEEALGDEGQVGQGDARRALELRLGVNKASTKKLDAMARNTSKDGTAKFQTRYHGAGTGRSTGTGFQPLNLVRGIEDEKVSPHVLDALGKTAFSDRPTRLVRDIMYGDPKWLDMIYGDALRAVSTAGRHWIKAKPGTRILAGDFVSIEAVLLACCSGEQWKIDAFAAGEKIYERMAEKIHKLPYGTVTKATHPHERQDGKTGELAFGYQGALNAWLKFDGSGRHTDERIIEICKAWRAEHPMVVAMWRGLETAALEATNYPGRETSYRQFGFEIVDEWLSMVLPNGKHIWYRDPEVRLGMPHWHKPWEEYDADGNLNPCFTGDCTCKPVPKLTYKALKTGQWKRVYTYGGKLTENAIQAISREVLKAAELRAEAAGYPLILDVYDEIVAQPEIGFGSAEEFAEIMKECPGDWARGWPINVDVWEGDRYRK